MGGPSIPAQALVGQVDAQAIDGLETLTVFTSSDARGGLRRMWPLSAPVHNEFPVGQVLISQNVSAYTLRGMHFQRGVHAERKVVSVIRGRAFDVVVDLRPDSTTYLGWAALELNEDTPMAFNIPRGLAHGFLTLTPNTEVSYIIDQPYVAEAGAGIRWDDPLIGIEWPSEPRVASAQDRSWPDLEYGFSALAD